MQLCSGLLKKVAQGFNTPGRKALLQARPGDPAGKFYLLSKSGKNYTFIAKNYHPVIQAHHP
jgi:hypothetical protein